MTRVLSSNQVDVSASGKILRQRWQSGEDEEEEEEEEASSRRRRYQSEPNCNQSSAMKLSQRLTVGVFSAMKNVFGTDKEAHKSPPSKPEVVAITSIATLQVCLVWCPW
jgi:hypothetical protein